MNPSPVPEQFRQQHAATYGGEIWDGYNNSMASIKLISKYERIFLVCDFTETRMRQRLTADACAWIAKTVERWGRVAEMSRSIATK